MLAAGAALRSFRVEGGIAPSPSPPKRPAPTGGGDDQWLSKRQKKAQAKAKARSNQAAIDRGVALALQNGSARQHQRGGKGGKGGKQQPLALLNGGNGDGAPGGKRGGKGKSKTTDGKPICYAYNDGTACRFTPCTFAHVCSICEGADHMRTNCPNKPA